MQNDPQEWIEPERYIPERFDNQSPYYLRPDGQKRHPLSFNPFIGGKRICLGKTFAEIVAKFIVPAMLCRMDFEFVDQEIKNGTKKKPKVNLAQADDPEILLRVTKQDLSKY